MRIKVSAGWRAVACAGSDGDLTPAEESSRVTDTATTVPAAEEIAGSAETTPSSSARQESTEDQSGTPQSKSTEGEQATGEQLEAVVLPQTTVIYFRTRAGSRSDTLKTIVQSTTGEMLGSKFIPIESTSSSLVVYSPENEEANVFHTYSSPSWAKHSKRPLTIDDQLYVETEWSSGDLDVVEYDPRRLARGREGDRDLLRAAIIGDTRSLNTGDFSAIMATCNLSKSPSRVGRPRGENYVLRMSIAMTLTSRSPWLPGTGTYMASKPRPLMGTRSSYTRLTNQPESPPELPPYQLVTLTGGFSSKPNWITGLLIGHRLRKPVLLPSYKSGLTGWETRHPS